MTKITSFFAPRKGGNSKQPLPEEKHRQSGTKRPLGNEGGDAGTSKRTFSGSISAPSSSMCPEAKELLVHLRDDCHGAEVGEDERTTTMTWSRALQRHTTSPSFNRLATFVHAERERSGHRGNRRGAVYPPAEETFAALNFTPLESVRVVIVGQDPYHGYEQGHGLCFSVKRGVATPPSLRNIYKELLNDPDVPFDNHVPRPSATAASGGAKDRGVIPPPRHGNLERWARQGVLLLNSVLTVRHGEANSHAKRGWEQFTDEVIRVLDRHGRESGRGLVFLLWGKPASSKAEGVIRGGKHRASGLGSGGEGEGKHTVICSSHPSPLSATKTNEPFLGSRCFSRANRALVERGLEPIDWNVDDAMVDS